MKKILVALTLLFSGIFFIPANPVQAAAPLDGCHSDYVKKVNRWTYTKKVGFGQVVKTYHKITFSGALVYWYCPNGKGANIIKPLEISWCWFFPNLDKPIDAWYAFQGVKFNPKIGDDSYTVNPPTYWVHSENDTKQQRCRTQNILANQRKWLRVDKHAGWVVNLTVAIGMQTDPHFPMLSKGSWYKIIRPIDDYNVGPWKHI